MRGIKVAALLAALVMLSACATPERPAMSREAWLETTSRTYSGKTQEDIFSAAEKLFRLADGDDFQISYQQGSMIAARWWTIYLVLSAAAGTDTWTITTEKTGDGVKAYVDVRTISSSFLGPTIGGPPIQGPAIYELFWERMDFLLGETGHWMTCQESEERIMAKKVWGSTEALCSPVNMKDDSPNS